MIEKLRTSSVNQKINSLVLNERFFKLGTLFFVGLAIFIQIIFAQHAFADPNNPCDSDYVAPPGQVVKVCVPPSVKGPDYATIIKNVTNTLSLIAGIAAVIAIIVGGILYIISAGDQKKVEAAKNTILYAVVGLVIALLAFSIATFVLKGVTAGP